MKQFLPKVSDFALLKVANDSLYFIEESNDLDYLLNKRIESKEVDSSFYVIDKTSKFKHSLSLNESLDIRSVKI